MVYSILRFFLEVDMSTLLGSPASGLDVHISGLPLKTTPNPVAVCDWCRKTVDTAILYEYRGLPICEPCCWHEAEGGW